MPARINDQHSRGNELPPRAFFRGCEPNGPGERSRIIFAKYGARKGPPTRPRNVVAALAMPARKAATPDENAFRGRFRATRTSGLCVLESERVCPRAPVAREDFSFQCRRENERSRPPAVLCRDILSSPPPSRVSDRPEFPLLSTRES